MEETAWRRRLTPHSLICFLIALLVPSTLGIIQAFRKKPKGQGKPPALPDSWSRWILEEKKPKQAV